MDLQCRTQDPDTSEMETEAASVPADMETEPASVSVGIQVYPHKKNAWVQAKPVSFSLGRKSIPYIGHVIRITLTLSGVQIKAKSKHVAIQCDLQSDAPLTVMKDISTQTERQHLPVHSSPLIPLPSESEVSDLEDHHPKDTSYCTFSPASTSS